MSDGIVKAVLGAVTEEKKKDGSVEPKDFFWDQFLKYISSAILALTLLNITIEFFRNGGVFCFHPPDTVSLVPSDSFKNSLEVYEIARDQAAFLNTYCVESIPVTEYFPLYILIHGLLLAAPHFIWSAIHKGDYDSFFSIAGKIDRLRSSETGEYSKENFDRVKKLEKEYGGTTKRIFLSYIGKLVLQFLVCLGSIAVSAGYLRNFSFSFNCPRSLEEDGVVPSEWPLNVTVPCVYTTLRILSVVRIADFILTSLAALLAVYGLVWCAVRHTEQLGPQPAAKFAFQSCLKPDLYIFAPIVRFSGRQFLKNIQEDYELRFGVGYFLWLLTHRVHSIKIGNCFYPRIMNDFDFLLLTLFRADASHGKVFKNIQISKELSQLTGRDHQLLHLYINIQQDMAAMKGREEEARARAGPGDQPSSRLTVRPRLTHSRNAEETFCSLDAESNSGQRPGRVTRCLTSCTVKACCCCCFKKKKKEKEEDKETTDLEGRGSEELQGMYDDFRHIFSVSEFDGDPEQTAFAYFKPYLGNLDSPEEVVSERHTNLHGMRNLIFWFVCKYGKEKANNSGRNKNTLSNYVAVDISFGTIGYALILSRIFRAVYSVNFHPYYRGGEGKQVVKEEEFFTNYSTVTYPDDIYTRNNNHIVQANRKILTPLVEHRDENKTVDMIMVGPVTEEPQKVSINLLLNIINSRDCIGEGALLLAVRPLRIGSQKVASFKYEPSRKLFKKVTEDKLNEEQQREVYRYVDGQKGYKVVCGGVSCVFEFQAYRYISHPNNDIKTADRGNRDQSRHAQQRRPNNDDELSLSETTNSDDNIDVEGLSSQALTEGGHPEGVASGRGQYEGEGQRTEHEGLTGGCGQYGGEGQRIEHVLSEDYLIVHEPDTGVGMAREDGQFEGVADGIGRSQGDSPLSPPGDVTSPGVTSSGYASSSHFTTQGNAHSVTSGEGLYCSSPQRRRPTKQESTGSTEWGSCDNVFYGSERDETGGVISARLVGSGGEDTPPISPQMDHAAPMRRIEEETKYGTEDGASISPEPLVPHSPLPSLSESTPPKWRGPRPRERVGMIDKNSQSPQLEQFSPQDKPLDNSKYLSTAV